MSVSHAQVSFMDVLMNCHKLLCGKKYCITRDVLNARHIFLG